MRKVLISVKKFANKSLITVFDEKSESHCSWAVFVVMLFKLKDNYVKVDLHPPHFWQSANQLPQQIPCLVDVDRFFPVLFVVSRLDASSTTWPSARRVRQVQRHFEISGPKNVIIIIQHKLYLNRQFDSVRILGQVPQTQRITFVFGTLVQLFDLLHVHQETAYHGVGN